MVGTDRRIKIQIDDSQAEEDRGKDEADDSQGCFYGLFLDFAQALLGPLKLQILFLKQPELSHQFFHGFLLEELDTFAKILNQVLEYPFKYLNTMKILVLGYTRSGKTEATRMLGRILGVKVVDSTSKYIIRDFAAKKGLDPEKILADKETYRKQLWEYGLARQQKDAAYPVDEAVREADVVSGVRTRRQLGVVRPLFDKVIWVDRPGVDGGFSDELVADDADEVVKNDSTLEDLEKKLTAVAL